MGYKVLNQEWEIIIVDIINPQLHRHTSWREFTSDDACVKVKELEEEKTMSIEQAREQFKVKYDRYPSSRMKLENIIAKL